MKSIRLTFCKSIKICTTKIFEKSIQANKDFWRFIKPFLTNKWYTGNCHISLIQNSRINWNDRKLAKTASLFLYQAEKATFCLKEESKKN